MSTKKTAAKKAAKKTVAKKAAAKKAAKKAPAKKKAAPQPAKAPAATSDGRPQPGSKGARYWEILDRLKAKQGTEGIRKAFMAEVGKKGLNHDSASCQFKLWRDYNGVPPRAGAVKVPAAVKTARTPSTAENKSNKPKAAPVAKKAAKKAAAKKPATGSPQRVAAPSTVVARPAKPKGSKGTPAKKASAAKKTASAAVAPTSAGSSAAGGGKASSRAKKAAAGAKPKEPQAVFVFEAPPETPDTPAKSGLEGVTP